MFGFGGVDGEGTWDIFSAIEGFRGTDGGRWCDKVAVASSWSWAASGVQGQRGWRRKKPLSTGRMKTKQSHARRKKKQSKKASLISNVLTVPYPSERAIAHVFSQQHPWRPKEEESSNKQTKLILYTVTACE
jgi:hypothetical protein